MIDPIQPPSEQPPADADSSGNRAEPAPPPGAIGTARAAAKTARPLATGSTPPGDSADPPLRSDADATAAPDDPTFEETEDGVEPDAVGTPDAGASIGGWEPNVRARALSVELRRIEFEIRELLKYGDIKRKRKYEGTRRWMELLEDVVTMRYSGQASDDALKRVTELVAKRQQLFRELNFVVATRHRWNT
ncbi:MAG: hypothetical protein FLDDKLPJ_03206 [Phycisphaerae bacterium]|nr:hypothetical protein [Phycisphaerae bacterium]